MCLVTHPKNMDGLIVFGYEWHMMLLSEGFFFVSYTNMDLASQIQIGLYYTLIYIGS